jgi:UDP-glucose:glycoprotein glucosyltransferase
LPSKFCTSSSSPSLIILIQSQSESIALEIPDAFFPLLDSLTQSHLTGTPRDVHTSIIRSATENGHLYDPDVTAAVEMTLALHAATPKVEAFYQLYIDIFGEQERPCTSWVDWYGEAVCDVDTLKQLIETHDPAST